MRQVSPTLAPVRPSLLLRRVGVSGGETRCRDRRPPVRASVLPLGLAPSRKLQHATLLAPLPPSLPRASLSCRRTHFLRLSLAAAFRVPPIMREEDRCPHGTEEGVIGVEGAKDGRRREGGRRIQAR